MNFFERFGILKYILKWGSRGREFDSRHSDQTGAVRLARQKDRETYVSRSFLFHMDFSGLCRPSGSPAAQRQRRRPLRCKGRRRFAAARRAGVPDAAAGRVSEALHAFGGDAGVDERRGGRLLGGDCQAAAVHFLGGGEEGRVAGMERAQHVAGAHGVAKLFVQRDAGGKVDRVAFLEPPSPEQHAGVADLLDVVGRDIALPFPHDKVVAVGRFGKKAGVAQHAGVAALGFKHLAALFKRRAVGERTLGHGAAGREVALARQHKHVGCQLQADLGQIGGAAALQNGHAFGHFQRVADVVAERLVHIGDERGHSAAVRRADRDHQAGKFDRIVEVLHERAGAHRHIKQDGIRTGGQLFAHDRGGDQRDATDRGRDVAQGVEQLVRRGDLPALADDRKADAAHLGKEFFLRERGAGAGHGLHLVDGAAGVAEAAAAHLGDGYAAGRDNGHNDQRCLVPHAAGRMFVDLDAGD